MRAVSWGEPEVQVCTNETAFFPLTACRGTEQLSHHKQQYNISNLTIAVEGIPLCMGDTPFVCLPRNILIIPTIHGGKV